MTIGIYKLTFKDLEDWVYIGQSSNIEVRYSIHCSNLKLGKSNYLMQEAFEISKEFPILEIIEEVDLSELNNRESYWINYYNSVSLGLNLTDKVDVRGRGEDNFNASINNLTAENIFLEIVNNPKKLLIEISKEFNSTIAIVNSIAQGKTHTWLQEKYPSEYVSMLMQSRKGLWDAEHQGIKYPPIKDPYGNIYNITNLQKFAREHNLNNSSLHQLLKGKRKSCSKWVLA